MNLFKSLWYLGGLDSIDPRISANDEAYGQTYGNRVATRKAFPPLGSARVPHAHTAPGTPRAAARPVSNCA